MKTDLSQSCGHRCVFQICWHIECSTFTASSFRIWNSSTGIPWPPLALLVVMLSKAHLTSHSRMSGSRWTITPSWLSGSWRSFLYSSSVYSGYIFLISSASVRSIPFLSFIVTIFAWDVPFSSVQFSRSCPTLCDPMNHSTPGLPVHHQLLEFTQTHVHRVRDDIQPSHPRSSLSPTAPNPSQHQSLFQWVSSSHEVAELLEFQL